jgi:3-dehydroquinate dehydratase-2
LILTCTARPSLSAHFLAVYQETWPFTKRRPTAFDLVPARGISSGTRRTRNPVLNSLSPANMAHKPIFVLNGPTLNLLGQREPHIYGSATLADIERLTKDRAAKAGLTVDFRQTNHEGQMIDWILEGRSAASGIVINGGAWTHTSIAIMDALRAAERPVVEVHLSNPYAREEFRQKSYVSLVAKGVICGLGPAGYGYAIDALANILSATKPD